MLKKSAAFIVGLGILLAPYTAFAAIAFDTSGSAATVAGVSTLNSSQTTGSLTDGILFACIWGSNSTPTSVTYAGSNMTSIRDYNTTAFGSFRLYGILNPTSGTQTTTATFAGNQNKILITTASYSGVNQSLTLDSLTNIAEQTTTSYAMAGTAVASGAWGSACTLANIASTAPTAGTNTTKRQAVRGTADSVWESQFDSNGTVSGSFTLNQTNSTSGDTDGILFSFAPPAPPVAPQAPLVMTFE